MPSRVSQREAIRDTQKTDVPTLPILAIRGYLCFRCLNHTDDLLRCGACKRAFYCSIDCQILDWHVAHKRHCDPLQHVNAIEEAESDEEQTWDDYTSALHHKAQVAKHASQDEQPGDMMQTVIGQPYCTTCHRSSIQVAPQTVLKPCESCHLVFTCGQCQPTHPDEECAHYRLLGELEQYKLRQFEVESTVTTSETTVQPKLSEQYRPLSLADGWLEYYSRISDKCEVGSFIADDFSFDATGSEAEIDKTRSKWLHLLLATDSMTIPLTVLAALEESIPDLLDRGTITLHLVGAAGKEFRNLKLFEEILHLLPTLQHLKVAIVGPESPGASAGQTGGMDQDIEMDCCPSCTAHGRRRTVTSFQGGYHEYQHAPQYRKPDLAVLFHSGRSQANVESWQPTTKFLVESGTNTLCTTYTGREAREEVAELDEMGVEFLVRPEVNKWRGLAPLPELLEGPEHGAYYNNYYRYIFRGTKGL